MSETTPCTGKPSWQRVWEEAIAPLLSEQALEVLEKALQENDPCLIQGATTQPPPLWCVRDWPCEGACVLGYMAWKDNQLEMVGEVEEQVARLCYEIDRHLGEPGGCRWFLNWVDSTPRREMIKQLLPVVSKTLASRREEMTHESL